MPAINLYHLQPRTFFRIVIIAVTLSIFLLSPLPGRLGTPAVNAQDSTLTPLQEPPASAQQVFVGVYPINIYNLDIQSNTFYMDFYIWFRWQGEINPVDTAEFVNAVEKWGMSSTPTYEEPITLPDGSFYQQLRVEGRFVQSFALSRFPLDHQELTIQIEDTQYTADQLVYLTDQEDSGYGVLLKVPGWAINGWQLESLLHRYDSQFGDTTNPSLESQYSAVRFALDIQRPVNYFIWKLFLPLLIILGANWITLLIHPSFTEVRTAMPATALLTTVFLQQSYSDALPEVGYLVLLDKIYVLAYLVIILTIAEVIITAGWVKEENNANFARVKRLDNLTLFVTLLLFVVGAAFFILFA